MNSMIPLLTMFKIQEHSGVKPPPQPPPKLCLEGLPPSKQPPGSGPDVMAFQ